MSGKEGKAGFTEAEMNGLSDAEREALDGDDDSGKDLQEIVDEDDAAGATEEEKKAVEEKARQEADTKAKAEADAKAKAEKDAADKAAADAKKKRDAELAAMSEADRKKAEEVDRAKADAAEKARKDAEEKTRLEAEEKAKKEREAAALAEEEDFDEPFAPAFTAKAPEKYEEQMAEFSKKEAADLAEFKENKIEIDEFLRRKSEIEVKRQELRDLKLKADIATESADQTAKQQWDWECRRFMRNTAKHEGIDYRQKGPLLDEFDGQVKTLANDPKNEGKPGEWFLREAHKRVKAIHNLGSKTTDDAAAKAAAAEAEKKAKEEVERKAKEVAAAGRRKDPKDLPKVLGGLPAAGSGELGNEGEFSHLDDLSGMELETAVAKMNADQQDRWARS